MKHLSQKIIIICVALAMVLACATTKDSTRTKAEETSAEAVVDGEGLYAAALLDRQKKDEGKEKVKQFLREIASAYNLSASSPEIYDNADGTANVTFEVKAKIGFDGDRRVQEVTRITGVNLFDFLSTGLDIIPYAHTNDFTIRCRDKKCKEIEKFMDDEVHKLVLFVKLGTFEEEELLSHHLNRQSHIYYNFKKEYKIKMSLSEIKSLSQLELKVFYDSKEYGQRGDVSDKQDQYSTAKSSQENLDISMLGLTVKAKNPGTLLKVLPGGNIGVIVTKVKRGSPADIAGLKEGDLISGINKEMIYDLDQYAGFMLKGIRRKKITLWISSYGIITQEKVINIDD